MILLDTGSGILTQPGIVGTLVLLGIVLFIGSLLITARVQVLIARIKAGRASAAEVSDDDLLTMDTAALTGPLARRKAALQFKLRGDELGGREEAFDDKALISRSTSEPDNPLVDEKIYSRTKLDVPPQLQKLVLWYLVPPRSGWSSAPW